MRLTKDQFVDMARNVQRAASTLKQVNNREKRRKSDEIKNFLKLAASFNIKLAETQTDVDISLSRRELRQLESLYLTRLQALLGTVIPGYEARISKSETDEERTLYKPYLEKAVASSEEYKNIIKLLSKELE